MSSTKHRHARLAGYSESGFPDSLSSTQKCIYGGDFEKLPSIEFLETFTRGFLNSTHPVIQDPVTSDGYVWYAQIDFEADGAQHAILLPKAGDLERRKHGTVSDRHISIQSKIPAKVEVEGWMRSHAGRVFSALIDVEIRERRRHHRRQPKKVAEA